MKRFASILILAAPLWAQANRDSYRVPYQAWRDAAGTMEQDSATPDPDFAMRAQTAAQAVNRFLGARADYFTSVRADAGEQMAWVGKPLVHAEAMLTTRPEVDALLSRASEFLSTTINTFNNVKDPAIQQVRQAMERERAALNALTQTLAGRTAPVRELIDATDEAEILRTTVGQGLANSAARREQVVTHIRNEAPAWAAYYRDLAEGAASTSKVSGNASPNTPAAAKPALVQRPSPAGATPLSRYVGAWEYPARNGIFLGTQPRTVELNVREENGKLLGTLNANFVIPSGRGGDPTLRVTFEGSIQQNRKQTLPLMTAEGVAGTIELIPGSAINLLEVNLQTAPNGNKFTTANFVLVKR